MGNEAANADLIQRPSSQPASITSCSVVTPLNASKSTGLFRRSGIPPIPSVPTPSSVSIASSASLHGRTISQLPAFFSLESMCTSLSPLPFPPAAAITSDNATAADRSHTSGGLAKAQRRSQSVVPAGFLPPFSSSLIANPSTAASGSPIALFPHMRSSSSLQQVNNQEGEGDKDTESSERKSEGGDAADDLFNAYMNLDNLDTLNSSAMEERSEDRTRMNSSNASESEAESNVNEGGGGGGEKKDANKRSAVDLTPMASRHYRSLSMDSLIGKLNFGVESSKLPPGNSMEALSRSGSMESNTSMDLLSGDFSSIELNKIMTNERLTEIALTDPKRAKRILANRQSAARSKERKLRYISELEYKVQTLQTETTTLSAQLTSLQRDSAGLTSQNNELRIRLQCMDQQAQLRDALSETLTAEVQRLKLAVGEITEAQLSKCLNQQMPVNPRIFQFHQLQPQQPNQQSTHLLLYQFQQHQQREEQQQSKAASKSSIKKPTNEKPVRMT